jgi:hypothetical protein
VRGGYPQGEEAAVGERPLEPALQFGGGRHRRVSGWDGSAGPAGHPGAGPRIGRGDGGQVSHRGVGPAVDARRQVIGIPEHSQVGLRQHLVQGRPVGEGHEWEPGTDPVVDVVHREPLGGGEARAEAHGPHRVEPSGTAPGRCSPRRSAKSARQHQASIGEGHAIGAATSQHRHRPSGARRRRPTEPRGDRPARSNAATAPVSHRRRVRCGRAQDRRRLPDPGQHRAPRRRTTTRGSPSVRASSLTAPACSASRVVVDSGTASLGHHGVDLAHPTPRARQHGRPRRRAG